MSSEEQTEFLKRAELGCTFAGWLTLNLSLNYYNKWVLSETDFRFPFLLTTVNKTVGLFVAISIMMLKKGMPQPQELLSEFKRPMVHFQGVATALNLGMNNWSLLLITLTLNQILKATVPLPTAALSIALEGKTYSWQLYGSMVVLVVGCVLASAGAMGNEPVLGIVVCIISTLATACWTVSSAVLLQQGAKPLDAVSLLFVSGPTCIATLLVFFLIPLPAFHQSDGTYYVAASELNRLGGDHRSGHAALPASQIVLYLGIAALMGSMYDIVHNHFVKITSSMNMTIMGNLKLIILIVLSMGILEHTRQVTVSRILGVFIAFIAIVWYSVFKLQEAQKKAAAKVSDIKQPLAAAPAEGTPLVKK